MSSWQVTHCHFKLCMSLSLCPRVISYMIKYWLGENLCCSGIFLSFKKWLALSKAKIVVLSPVVKSFKWVNFIFHCLNTCFICPLPFLHYSKVLCFNKSVVYLLFNTLTKKSFWRKNYIQILSSQILLHRYF